LLGIPERAVPQEPRQRTARTQPYPVGDPLFPQSVDIAPEGFKLINGGRIFTPFWDQPVVYRPQMAVNWPPSSYDPLSNRFFVCGIDNLAMSAHDTKPFAGPTFEGSWLQNGRFAAPDVARRGVFAAYDLKTNRLVWEQAWPQGCFSGSLATAGGLVFTGRSDGRLTALDAASGALLWQFQTDAGVNAPASTFEWQGTQYLAVMSAGTLYGAGKKGDSIWLFSLNGKMESLPAPPSTPRPGAAPAPAPGPVVFAAGAPDLPQGKILYTRFCEACHGEAGLGGHGGGAALGTAAHEVRTIIATATNGQNQNMPAFRGALSPEQLRDVAAFISHELFGQPLPN